MAKLITLTCKGHIGSLSSLLWVGDYDLIPQGPYALERTDKVKV